MTGVELHVPRPPRLRLRLPASRGGLAWLAVLVIVGGFLAVQFGRQVYMNWSVTDQAAALHDQVAEIEARNEQLREELAYLQSDAYVDARARAIRNLGQPDERILIIPPGNEAPVPAALLPKPEPAKPLLEQWLDLFFGP